MSIQSYKEKKGLYEGFIDAINHARGLTADGKAEIKFYRSKCWDGDLTCHLHMSYGSSNFSSGYDCEPHRFEEYILRALNRHKNLILDTALELCKKDVDKELISAEEEINKLQEELKIAREKNNESV